VWYNEGGDDDAKVSSAYAAGSPWDRPRCLGNPRRILDNHDVAPFKQS